MTEIPADDTPIADYRGMLDLTDQVHVVLGAGQGIGRQTAHALAGAGATVACVDRKPELAERIAEAVGGSAWGGDATQDEVVRDLMEAVVERHGRLDGVIDIIGVAKYGSLLEMTLDDWAWHRRVAMDHAILAVRYGVPKMTAGGSFTFVASVNGLYGSPNLGPYSSEKAAMMALVRTAAVEFGDRGIRFNAVAPGMIRTPQQQANPAWTPELVQKNVDITPLKKLGKPSDVASVLLFLASPMAGHITGQTIVVDGGLGMANSVVVPGREGS